MAYSATNWPVALVTAGIIVRWLVAQFPHSGSQKPPMFGDYEAQRHWMELTTNLPVREWYTNSTNNDLLYWGLDYPPLTAYHMFLLGHTGSRLFNASWTQLHKSRGLETYEHKIFMRATVILSELLVYTPAVVYYFYKTQPIQYTTPPSNVHKQNIAIYCAFFLFYPAQVLIDHGHFQYNSVFMGLVLWAVIFIMKDRQYVAAVLFTLALSYKQMSLYYSLPFFWYITSKNLRLRPLWKGLRAIILVGLLVTSILTILFWPYLYSAEAILQVIRRIFPINRGLFEDKVANFWFNLSIFYKYKGIYSTEKLLQASTVLTLLGSLPAGLHLLFRPTIRNFKYALVTTSMVFFLFSFQVHEKTILVPALPILLLSREHPIAVNWFVVVSTFSLQPLLIRDEQTVPYFVLLTIYVLLSLDTFRGLLSLTLSKLLTHQNLVIITYLTSILSCFIFSAVALFIRPPPRYPHLHPTINAFFCCLHFMGFLLFFYFREFNPAGPRRVVATDRVILIKKTK